MDPAIVGAIAHQIIAPIRDPVDIAGLPRVRAKRKFRHRVGGNLAVFALLGRAGTRVAQIDIARNRRILGFQNDRADIVLFIRAPADLKISAGRVARIVFERALRKVLFFLRLGNFYCDDLPKNKQHGTANNLLQMSKLGHELELPIVGFFWSSQAFFSPAACIKPNT